ncbi:hypothetical protein ANN_07139 [Periplaneta americana]|uniref:Reverse transcriptase domain-containing protein n=1 Tax=Periplaneta americana TaxID=6978 RepID=A0ABQ8TG29_PERAM|nr:hypothetical protein ANN_07139 [Periplaneta americana]
MIIPPKKTKYFQPLDIYFLRQYKIYARRITDCVRTLAENPELNLGNRVFIMKMHSVIHNQLSAPVYRPMLQYSWQSAGYVNREQDSDFRKVIQVTFDFSALECGSEDCSVEENLGKTQQGNQQKRVSNPLPITSSIGAQVRLVISTPSHSSFFHYQNNCIRQILTNLRGLELNGLHQLLVYADDVNMLGENTQTIRENMEILLEASRAIGLEVNPEKTKHMIMSRDQNIVRNGNIKIGDLSFEEVEKFKYLGATVTNVNDTREEIKRRINMGNACYYSVEKLLSSSLLSKNLKVRIYKTVILPVLLYGCETWTLTLREEHRLRVFENKVIRKIFGAKRDEVTGEWRKLHNTELHALYSSPDIIRNLKSRRLRWAGYVARMGESRNAYRVLVGRPEEKDL